MSVTENIQATFNFRLSTIQCKLRLQGGSLFAVPAALIKRRRGRLRHRDEPPVSAAPASRLDERGAAVHRQQAAAALACPSLAITMPSPSPISARGGGRRLGRPPPERRRRRRPTSGAAAGGRDVGRTRHHGRWLTRPGSRRTSPLGGAGARPLVEHGRFVAAGGGRQRPTARRWEERAGGGRPEPAGRRRLDAAWLGGGMFEEVRVCRLGFGVWGFGFSPVSP